MYHTESVRLVLWHQAGWGTLQLGKWKLIKDLAVQAKCFVFLIFSMKILGVPLWIKDTQNGGQLEGHYNLV